MFVSPPSQSEPFMRAGTKRVQGERSVGCARRQRSFGEDDSVPGLLFGAFPVLLNEVRPSAPLVSPENVCTTEAGTRPETQEVGFSSEGEEEVGVDTDAI